MSIRSQQLLTIEISETLSNMISYLVLGAFLATVWGLLIREYRHVLNNEYPLKGSKGATMWIVALGASTVGASASSLLAMGYVASTLGLLHIVLGD